MSIQISVVVPTYKRPGLLERCLVALQKQLFPASLYEIIVVSDGPDYQTHALVNAVQQLNAHFYYYELKTKKGPAAARNAGWHKANGELIAFTDDDCVPDEHWLKNLWLCFKMANGADICLSGRVVVPLPALPTDYEKNVAKLEEAAFITANCACPRSVLEKTGGFDEDFPIAWREDSALEFAIRSINIPIVKVLNALVKHPVRKTFWGVSLAEQKKSIYNVLLHKKYPKFFSDDKPNPVYYGMITSSFIALLAFFMHQPVAGYLSLGIWLVLFLSFALRRLHKTTLSFSHVSEMLVTSAIIPYLSVYWTLVGAIRYKVFYL